MEAEIIIRKYKSDDLAFICSTFTKKTYCDEFQDSERQTYIKNFRKKFYEKLSNDELCIAIACHPEDINTIFGVIITESSNNDFHFMHVKSSVRSFDIVQKMMINYIYDGHVPLKVVYSFRCMKNKVEKYLSENHCYDNLSFWG